MPNDGDGIVRKTEKDKYFFLIRKSSLDALEAGKFSLLEDVKTVNVGNELALTISMGISYGSHYYIQNAEQARSAIDIALGRGGDQVVVKEGYNTRYFGGKTESVEKYTRVKARVKAHALKEIITAKSSVFIMGHHIPDMDVLGAVPRVWVGVSLASIRAKSLPQNWIFQSPISIMTTSSMFSALTPVTSSRIASVSMFLTNRAEALRVVTSIC